MLKPSVCLVTQGRKRTLVGRARIDYAAGDVLVALSDIPTRGQVIDVSPEHPYLGMRVFFEPSDLADLLDPLPASPPIPRRPGPAVGALKASPELIEALGRLMRLLEHPNDIASLAPLLRKEILYRLLGTEVGRSLAEAFFRSRNGPQILPVLHWIQDHFSEPLMVAELAQRFAMSPATLHRKFKDATHMSPVQYQKALRLIEARRVLLTGIGVSQAAFTVGYESPSQFVREYQRHFGAPPRRDTEAWRRSLTDGE